MSHQPAGHAIAGVSPPGQYSPASQGAQTGGVVLVPGAVCSVPASQAPTGRHMLWFGAVEKVPMAQSVHMRSTDALGVLLT